MGKRIPIISFFSGGGFMDMGFINAGFDVVFANEFDKVFAQLHDEGMSSWAKGHKKKFCPITSTESLSSLKWEDIMQQAFPNGTPTIWGIIGGPPCQDFTMSGNGLGFSGQRGKMTQIFYNRIRKMRPAFFVMENVAGLLMRKKSKEILDMLLLNNICEDYYIDRTTLNALYFGVPQYRQRVFIVGLRKDIFPEVATKEPTLASISSMNFPWPQPKYPKADMKFNWPKENAFGETPMMPDGIPYELCVQKCIDGATELPNGNEHFELVKDADSRRSIKEGDTKRRSFKRLHRYRYSPTTCFGNNEVFLHPYENRRLTVREALRIQGVDDKYILGADRLSAKFKIISNGVPVNLANAVANSVFAFVERAIPEDER